jgi:TRAP-type C4-dicarboxylate transport system substrate-binding protein
MKSFRVTILIVTVLFMLQTSATAATIKLGTLAPEGSPWYNIIRDMAEAWEEGTGGEIQFRIYPGGVAGDDPDMVRKMRIGQLDAAILSGTGLYDIAPEVQALMMPMMLASYEEFDFVLTEIAPQLETILETNGFKVLNWGDAGWVNFFTQTQVVSPDDLRPLRLFSWAGYDAYNEAWKDAGFQPVPLSATEIHTGLQSGLINAVSGTPIAALSFQWFALANHMTDINWAPLIGATVISTSKWRSIPEDLKPVLIQAAGDAGARIREETRRLSDDAVEVMKEHGLVVHHVPPDIVTQWENVARSAYPKIVGDGVPASLVAQVERLRDEYRTLHPSR